MLLCLQKYSSRGKKGPRLFKKFSWGMELRYFTNCYGVVYMYTFLPACLLDFDGLDLCQYTNISHTQCVSKWPIQIQEASQKKRFPQMFRSPKYCWWKKSCTIWDGWNPINNGIIIILGGAGFCPSTVLREVLFDFSVVTSFFLTKKGTQKNTLWKPITLGAKHL